MTDPIIKTIDVPCGVNRAFEIFVNRISAWWPLDGHAASAAAGKAALGVTIEPKVGGAIYETMYDGTRSDWGEILEYEAGRKLAMTWHPGNNAENPTRVDVAFEQMSDALTRVTLTHSGWEVWADEAADKRQSYDTGWDFVFVGQYAAAVE
ncbi:SRPBCC domain-containing protein [Tateyamaria sp.]|uniref:SRPBCC domain-containing protein n=1 Tax=Tateyamaria sp. TaxID=1929288 RepID=UPI00329AA259